MILALARLLKHALTKQQGIRRLKRAVPRANQVLELKSVRGMAQAVPLLLRPVPAPEEAALKGRVGTRLHVKPWVSLVIRAIHAIQVRWRLILVRDTVVLAVFTQVVTPEPMRLAIRPRWPM